LLVIPIRIFEKLTFIFKLFSKLKIFVLTKTLSKKKVKGHLLTRAGRTAVEADEAVRCRQHVVLGDNGATKAVQALKFW
jgi:hypothetical protein